MARTAPRPLPPFSEVVMKVTLKIKRYDSEQGGKPTWSEYTVDVEPTDRVLDALDQIKWFMDGTLGYRRSCAHGICGSDAVIINGVNRLACKTLVQDVSPNIKIEPLAGFRVLKDLIVDMEPFFAQYRSILPYLINNEPPPLKERLQSPEERERFDDTTKCILCAACTTSCPIYWSNPAYVGPAAIVNAHRFIFDSRDEGAGERLDILNSTTGVWRCRTIFNCTEACPRGIEVTNAIQEVKRAIAFDES
jgi:succinate dehydrogenase / fumarate reductase iron-sulfur subunit